MNYMKTAILLAAMTALFMGIGFLIGGRTGMLVALAVAAAMNFWSYWGSDKAVLNMYGAQEVDQHSAPDLYQMTWEMTQRAGMPMPRLFIIHEDQPNAFATGRDPEHASVAATTGLLDRLSPEEVEGVMAHELAHVKNRDTLIMTITATIAGAIGMIANFGLFFGGGHRDNEEGGGNGLGMVGGILIAIIAPMAAMVVQMAISRTREYAADAEGARICGNPLWLANALERLEQAAHVIPNRQAEHSPATAHLFIVNPLSGKGVDNLFSTHPNMGNRVAALRAMAAEAGMTWDNRGPTAPKSGPWTQPPPRKGPWG